MKRVVPIFLAAVLFLSGCKQNVEPEAETTVPAATAVPTAELCGGAVSAFPQNGKYEDLELMGDKLILLEAPNKLTVLRGTDGSILAEAAAEGSVRFSSPDFSVSPTGIAYFLKMSGEVVLTNPNLQISDRIPLPKDAKNPPAVSLKNQEIYYCTGEELRALDMNTRISRMVRSLKNKSQKITGSYFDGDLLQLQVTDAENVSAVQYVETASGRTVSEDEELYRLCTGGNHYFAFRMDGIVPQQIFGSRDGAPDGFIPRENIFPVPVMNGAVRAELQQDRLYLEYYDLEAKAKTASALLKDVSKVMQIKAGAGFVWILAENAHQSRSIYRWDVKLSQTDGQTPCTQELYSEDNIDARGMDLCRKRAEKMNTQYGVRIYLGEDAILQADKLHVKQEYQIPAVNTMLDELEPVLALFPGNFLKTTMRNGWIKIGLVRKIEDGNTYSQFFKGDDAWILLSLDSDIPDDFIQALGYAVDSHVLGNSRKYDFWEELNPKDFQYNLGDPEQSQDGNLARGDERAFADIESMSFPYVERSRMFYYAVTERGKEMFHSPVMQKKLYVLCRAIREAYELERSPDTFLWEQYLNESLAYVK